MFFEEHQKKFLTLRQGLIHGCPHGPHVVDQDVEEPHSPLWWQRQATSSDCPDCAQL